jgi:isopropylmalate/homocitrate/citramalate synthase
MTDSKKVCEGRNMYVNNVREALDRLTEDEFEEYLKRLRLVLRKRYKKNVKPSDLKNRVKEFINGKDPKIDYFESSVVLVES